MMKEMTIELNFMNFLENAPAVMIVKQCYAFQVILPRAYFDIRSLSYSEMNTI